MADRPANIRFSSDGLVSAIVQQASNGTVLMLVEMNQEALALTLQTGSVHAWSRSRQYVYEQHDKSGQEQQVVSVTSDADGEALLIQVNVASLTDEPPPFSLPVFGVTSAESEADTRQSSPVTEMLGALYDLIQVRRGGQDTSSYVYSLFQRGHDVMCKKVGEEAAEVIIASKNQVDDEVIYEMADLWFHATVLLGYHNIHPHDVLHELQRRFGQPGGGKEGYSAGAETPKPSAT